MMSTILAVDLAKSFKLDMFDVNDIGKKIEKKIEFFSKIALKF